MKKTLLAVSTLAAMSTVWAAEESPWSWRVGVTRITPHVNSDNVKLLSGTEIVGLQSDVGGDSELSGGINYRFDQNWAVDVPLALPFKQKLYGAGALGAPKGQIGSVKVLPATALLQYHFSDKTSSFRPYVGAGLTYAKFFGEENTPGNSDLKVQSKLAPSIQLGAQYKLSDTWALDVNYIQTYLGTRTELGHVTIAQNTTRPGTLDAKLNPSALSVGLVRSF